MCGDGGHVKSNIGITSSGNHNYFKEDGSDYDGQRVGMDPGGRCTGDRREFSNQVIHPAEKVHCCTTGGLIACI